MGYIGKLEDKLIAQKLRKRGYSYNQILKSVSVSKDTLSRWCRDIKLTKKQKQKLIKRKLLGQKKGSIIAAENKRKKRLELIKKIFIHSKKDIRAVSKRDRFIAGIALYAAEGNKTEGQGGFSNSDPKIIKFMMGWFKEFCIIPLDKYRGAIWLHEGRDEKKAKEFWSNLTGIPINQFHKTYIAKDKIDSRKIRKNIHSYGVFAIRFSHTEIQRRIMGWILAFFHARIRFVL